MSHRRWRTGCGGRIYRPPQPASFAASRWTDFAVVMGAATVALLGPGFILVRLTD